MERFGRSNALPLGCKIIGIFYSSEITEAKGVHSARSGGGLRRAGAWPAAPPGPVGAVGRCVRAFGAPEALMGQLGYERGES